MRKTGFWIFAATVVLAMASAVCWADQTDDLFAAIKAKDLGRVRALLDAGANVNVLGENIFGANNISPLSYALNWGSSDIAALLIDRGADVNFKDPLSEEAVIEMAAQRGDTEIVRLLLEKGADANVMDNFMGSTPLTAAAQFGNTEAVKLLLDHGVPVDQLNKSGWTALQLAATTAHSELVRLLLDRGADVNHKDKSNLTPLFFAACLDCSPENTRLLLAKGADVQQKDNLGRTALFNAACADCNPEIARLLLSKGARVNVQDNQGKTAFYYARINANQGVIAALVKAGANGGKMPPPPPTQLTAAASRFLAGDCQIGQPDIDIIPKLDAKVKRQLMSRIALRDCSLLHPFTATREYYRQLKPKERIPMPPSDLDASYLTEEELKRYTAMMEEPPI
jgi:ankyrin repeat protein